MKKLIQLLLLLVLGVSLSVTKAQVIESFDTDLSADPTYDLNIEGDLSRIDYTLNNSDFKEGTGSGHVNFVIGAYHQWGSYAQLIKRVPDGEPLLDWAISDSLSIWIKVLNAPTIPANMVFRIQIADRPTETDAIEEYIYENATVLDAVGDWFELKVPLYERPQNEGGDLVPNDEGFILAPTTWGGFYYNNRKLDFDKIVGYNISAITTGWDPNANIPADSVVVLLDGFKRFGLKSIPAIIFNGVAYGPYVVQPTWSWGQSSMEVEAGAGPLPNTNAIKWVQGNEWGNGWTGIGMNIDPPFNMAGAWQKDSVKFKLKCEDGVGPLRMQFEGGGGKVGTVFQPITDNQWHDYKLALKDMVYQDNTSGFDSSAVNVVGLMAEASAIAGKVIYITDWWTGNPEFDVIPPSAPQNVSAFAGDKQNIIMWDDVPGETSEKYDVYYSVNPFTTTKDPGVEVVALNILEDNGMATHLLFAPATDQDVTYYYAVVCKDASGNQSVLSANTSALTNTAKGVTTISMNAPANFQADGDLSEWQSITPFRMFVSDGTGHVVANQKIDSDADCSAKSWVAVDQDYLYVAFDVYDDVFSPSASSTSYLNDSPDIYLGLYNWHGFPHTTLKRGAEPDYHFRFAYNRVLLDNLGGATVDTMDSGNYYFGEAFGSGYRVEFRIKWTDLAAIGNDEVFTPVEGFRIPIDYSINDADLTGEREGILTYSVNNEDKSWGDVSRWAYTWIGNLWNPTGVEQEGQVVKDYSLSQNYPNPFNPSTQIKFSIKESGLVSLKVYDMLGREVATIVNKELSAGNYSYSFNASGLASGIYLYRLETGSFIQTNKMMLLK